MLEFSERTIASVISHNQKPLQQSPLCVQRLSSRTIVVSLENNEPIAEPVDEPIDEPVYDDDVIDARSSLSIG